MSRYFGPFVQEVKVQNAGSIAGQMTQTTPRDGYRRLSLFSAANYDGTVRVY